MKDREVRRPVILKTVLRKGPTTPCISCGIKDDTTIITHEGFVKCVTCGYIYPRDGFRLWDMIYKIENRRKSS